MNSNITDRKILSACWKLGECCERSGAARRMQRSLSNGQLRRIEENPMMKFRARAQSADEAPAPNTIIGVGSSFRGTLMVSGTLRIEGEFDGDILNCERLEIG